MGKIERVREMGPSGRGRSGARRAGSGALLLLCLGLAAPAPGQTVDGPAGPEAPLTMAPSSVAPPIAEPLEAVVPAGNESADTSAPATEAPAPGALPAAPESVAAGAVETDAASAADIAPQAADAGLETLPHDLSPFGMFAAADAVVKAVMIGLVLASIATWTVWLAKTIEILVAKARLRRALAILASARDLDAADAALAGRGGPAPLMLAAVHHEAGVSAEAIARGEGQGLLGRVTSHLSRIEARAGRRLNLGTGLLATIGSVAPFVGLFGTVWGIMNSFIGISKAQTTNLAVVAPGIAEALLATALGLVAAIPAVVIYNIFARSIGGYRALLGDVAAAVERLASRDLDSGRLSRPHQWRAAAE